MEKGRVYRMSKYITPSPLFEAPSEGPIMSKSLYAQYMRERENAEVLEYPWGFAIYKVAPDHVYLQDIYVVPQERDNNRGQDLMEEVAAIARSKGIKTMFGSIVPSAKGSARMEHVMLHLGFELDSAASDIIYYRKKL
jgi:GNAT superfamily N-acetyltransferase